MKKAWRSFSGGRRLSGRDAGARARPVWVCQQCGLWHDSKPHGCLTCGVLAVFDHFHSTSEAKTWAKLQLRQRAGDISELRRQVPLELVTIHRKTGEPRVWGKCIIDFAYIQDGQQVYADHKPSAGMSYDAELKMRCLIAAGYEIRFFNERGEVS